MSKIYWRRAHPVRLPDRIDTPVHAELSEAWNRDQSIADGMKRLALELDRELERDWEGR